LIDNQLNGVFIVAFILLI